MKSTLLFALVAGLFTTGAAFAQATPAATPAAAPDQAAKIQRHFAKLDTNGDGVISRDEAAASKRLAKHFDQIDTNKDGKLSKDELSAHHAAMQAKHLARRAKFDAKFKAADTNGDGALTKAEVTAAKLTHLAKHFDQIDANKDGKVTRDELRAFMQSRHKHSTAENS